MEEESQTREQHNNKKKDSSKLNDKYVDEIKKLSNELEKNDNKYDKLSLLSKLRKITEDITEDSSIITNDIDKKNLDKTFESINKNIINKEKKDKDKEDKEYKEEKKDKDKEDKKDKENENDNKDTIKDNTQNKKTPEEIKEEEIQKKEDELYKNESYQEASKNYNKIKNKLDRLIEEGDIDYESLRNSNVIDWALTGNKSFLSDKDTRIGSTVSDDEAVNDYAVQLGSRAVAVPIFAALLPVCPVVAVIFMLYVFLPDEATKALHKAAPCIPNSELRKKVTNYAKEREKNLRSEVKPKREKRAKKIEKLKTALAKAERRLHNAKERELNKEDDSLYKKLEENLKDESSWKIKNKDSLSSISESWKIKSKESEKFKEIKDPTHIDNKKISDSRSNYR